MSGAPFLTYWAQLNAALDARRFTAATYREARDFWESGYRDPAQVARQWIPDDVTALEAN